MNTGGNDIDDSFTGIEDLHLGEVSLRWLWLEHLDVLFTLFVSIHPHDALM